MKKTLGEEINAVLNQTSLTAMKQSYAMLNDEKKELLWKSKLSYVIQNDQSLTSTQKKYVQKLYNLLADNGIKKMKENHSIADDFIANNGVEMLKIFKPEQLYFLIENPYFNSSFSISNSKTYYAQMSNPNISTFEAAGECACRYDWGCGFGNICEKSGCSGGSDCGLFGTSTCKGVCKQGNGGPVLE